MDEEHYNILYLERLYFLKNWARILYVSWAHLCQVHILAN